jgi:hypothetical protein
MAHCKAIRDDCESNGERKMSPKRSLAIAAVAALFMTIAAAGSEAQDKVKVDFIGPLTGGASILIKPMI